MRQQAGSWLRGLLYAAVGVGGLWLALRFLLPWLAPFLLSFGIAALLEPLVRLLVRRGWRRGAAAGLANLSALGLLLWGLSALLEKLAEAAANLAGEVPALAAGIAGGLSRLEERALSAIDQAPPELAETLRLALEAAGKGLYTLPGQVSQTLLELLRRLAQSSPDVLLFLATAGIGSYFCSAGYPRILAFLAAQIPQGLKKRLSGMEGSLKESFGGWLRAQLMLMGLTFFELLLAFLLLRVKNAVGLAAVTALIDALPVFGTGAVLIPWALVCLLLGHVGRGLGLLAAWLVITLVQNAAQAKFLGDQIGLAPLASLMAVYVGWRICGVGGMILFPVLLAMAQQLNDRGVLHLWRQAE
jgi:sporulation integral membrane protein YtvI